MLSWHYRIVHKIMYCAAQEAELQELWAVQSKRWNSILTWTKKYCQRRDFDDGESSASLPLTWGLWQDWNCGNWETAFNCKQFTRINQWLVSFPLTPPFCVAYIDFCRAFDSISHPKLLLKLSAYGLCWNLFHWIKAFLTNRRQLVRINSSYSNICSITKWRCTG